MTPTNVLVIESSPRAHGNSDLICDEFIRGAREAGHAVEKYALRDHELHYCRACYACFRTGKCVIKDCMAELIGKIQDADVLVLATPVYFRAINGQMKTMIDRLLPAWQDMGGHDVYLVITGHDGKDGLRLADTELRDIFGGLGNNVVRTIWGESVWQKGEALGMPAMEEAYETGRGL